MAPLSSTSLRGVSAILQQVKSELLALRRPGLPGDWCCVPIQEGWTDSMDKSPPWLFSHPNVPRAFLSLQAVPPPTSWT